MSFREIFYEENQAEATWGGGGPPVSHVSLPAHLNADKKYWLLGSIQTQQSAAAARSNTALVDDVYVLFQPLYAAFETFQLVTDDFVSHAFLVNMEAEWDLDASSDVIVKIDFLGLDM